MSKNCVQDGVIKHTNYKDTRQNIVLIETTTYWALTPSAALWYILYMRTVIT